jgi:hypothetical protein
MYSHVDAKRLRRVYDDAHPRSRLRPTGSARPGSRTGRGT